MDKKENILDNNISKEEKNLFSIASQEIEEEQKINSFSDAIKELEESPKEEISFGNLFQATEVSNSLEEDANNLEIEKKDESTNDGLDLNAILEQEKEEVEESTVETVSDPTPITETPTEVEESNPFISIESQEEKSEESSVEITAESTPITETPTEVEESNPFISIEPQEEKTEESSVEVTAEPTPITETSPEVVEESNPFLSIGSQEDEKEENPFITNTSEENNAEPKTINDALEVAKENIETNNPFIIEDSEDKAPPTFNDNSATSETTKVNEQNNPFFQNTTFDDQTNPEINPFFQNKIELNEKQLHQNNNKLDLSDVPHYNVKVQKKKPKKSKLIIGVLSYAVFIWLLLIGITLLIYVANIKIKEMKGDFSPPKYNAYVVLTGSMLPHIQVEDVVVTKKVDAAELEEGDIITFASSDDRYYGTIITHRIQKKFYDSTTGKYTFQSKGDNNNVADNALVEEDNIYGKVILKIPKLGYLQVFLASKGGWILVILIPCAVVISFDIMKLFKMIARKRKLKIVK